MVLNMRSEGRGQDEVEAGFEVEVKCVQPRAEASGVTESH